MQNGSAARDYTAPNSLANEMVRQFVHVRRPGRHSLQVNIRLYQTGQHSHTNPFSFDKVMYEKQLTVDKLKRGGSQLLERILLKGGTAAPDQGSGFAVKRFLDVEFL